MSDPINPTHEELLLHQALMKAWHEMWASGTTDVDLLGINQHLIDAARLEGIRLGLEAAAEEVSSLASLEEIRVLDPATIAKETAR